MLSILGGMWIAGFLDFDSVCISFIILVLYFSWGFVTPHC